MADLIRQVYKDMVSSNKLTGSDKELKLFRDRIRNARSPMRRQIIVVDPITLQPIKSTVSLKSQGNYKKLNSIKILSSEKKPLPKLFNKKECSPGKIKSVLTGKCIRDPKLKRSCPIGKVVNPKTGRCIKIKTKV